MELTDRRSRSALHSAPPRPIVGSEVGTLRHVLVHRPGPELRRCSPPSTSCARIDNAEWAERASQEHDAFADVLAEAGVVVVYLQELLAQVLGDSDVRARVVARSLQQGVARPNLCEPLSEWLQRAPADALASWLIGGLTWRELPFGRGLADQVVPSDFVLPPLPDQMFTRDTSTWLYDGVAIHAVASDARQREAVHLDAVYRHHPLFASSRHSVWAGGVGLPAGSDGRDVLVLGSGAVVAGISGGPSAAAIEALAEGLFAGESMRYVIAVPLRGRATHLDSLLTMVDCDAFMVRRELTATLPAYLLHRDRRGIHLKREGELLGMIARVLGVPKLRLLATRGDRRDGVLALRPGTVLAYVDDVETTAQLRHEGIEVVTIEGFDLGRCPGGLRRLTCPLERDSLPGNEPR